MTRLLLLAFTSALALAVAAAPARAAPPAVQLLVELRWVDSALPPAAQAAVRDGAVVVGTAGSVSPAGGAVVTSTAAAEPAPLQRLVVHNGQRASLALTTAEPLQWADMAVAVAVDPASRRARVWAAPREGTGDGRTAQRITVTPSWPGGAAPVQVAFSVAQDGAAFDATQRLPLARWQTVARTGAPGSAAGRGMLSSSDAAGRPERALQLRVSVQP